MSAAISTAIRTTSPAPAARCAAASQRSAAVYYICLLDRLRARREAIIGALHPLLDEADVSDTGAFDARMVRRLVPDSIVLVGLTGASDEFDFVRSVSERGCAVLVYGCECGDAPLTLRCRALLAGAAAVLDSSQPQFASELRRRLSLVIRRHTRRRDEEQRLKQTMARLGIVGQSAAMLALGRWILKVGPLSDLPVLISGETGTGKELVARGIHEIDPKRHHGPFVPLNCAALNATLVESELFGHRKGAFTGASQDRRGLIRSAHTGTLFLDEIGDLELAVQAKLLRVLQENRVRGVGEDREDPVSVRVIAATNRELAALVEEGRFRMDLFYRLNLLATRAPSLAERGDDLEVLVAHFIEKYGGGRALRAAPSLLAALKSIALPGNVRQLENLVRYAVVHARDDGTLGVEELPASVWDQLARADPREPADLPAAPDWTTVLHTNSWNLSRSLMACERHFLKAALTRSQGNQSATARLLGITPRSIYNKIRKHRLAG